MCFFSLFVYISNCEIHPHPKETCGFSKCVTLSVQFQLEFDSANKKQGFSFSQLCSGKNILSRDCSKLSAVSLQKKAFPSCAFSFCQKYSPQCYYLLLFFPAPCLIVLLTILSGIKKILLYSDKGEIIFFPHPVLFPTNHKNPGC